MEMKQGRTEMKSRRKSRKNMLLDVLIIFLSIAAIVQLTGFIHQYRIQSSSFDVSDDMMLYSLKDENYASLLDYAFRKEESGEKLDSEEQALQAVAFYYDAAAMYKAYMKTGDEKSAKDRKAEMSRQAQKMGEYAYAAKDIDSRLGIETE